MADTIEVTQGSGTTMATDDVAGVHYPRVKISAGADGSAADVNIGGGVEASALRVTIASDSTGVLSVDDNGSSLTVDGSVTANAGTDLNTSLLALESGGNLATIAGAIKAEDAAHSSGHTGIMALAVRSDAGTAFAADGDYVPLSVDSSGAVRVTGGGGGVQYTEADTDASITGTAILWEDGSDTLRAVSAAKPLPVEVITGGGGGVQYTEGDIDGSITGTAVMWEDTGNELKSVSAAFPLPVSIAASKLEDSASSNGDSLIPISAVRRDSPVVGSGTDGDYSTVNVDANGKLWTNAEITATIALPVTDNGGSLTVDGSVTANAGTDLNTSLLALEAGGNLAAAATSLAVMDDWDESDRAKVNPIAGQAGVQGGSGTVSALTQRVVLATDVALPAGTNAIGKLAANSGVDIGDVDVTSISAGSNLIGDVALNGRATGSSIAITRFVSGASTNLTAVKASAGTLYGFSISNVKSSAVYVRFYNIASGSVTVGTSTVFAGPFIGPGATTGAGHTFSFPLGIPFSNAGWSVSITAGSLADNDTTATAASDCAITIMYV